MKPRVYIETFGCQMNVADTERAATGLRSSGYDLCDSVDEADVVLLNTCSVREKAERKVYTRIGEVRAARSGKQDVLVGVMGCVAQLEGASVFDHAPSVDMVIGTRATDRIPLLIERAQGGERKVLDLDERGETRCRCCFRSHTVRRYGERHSRHPSHSVVDRTRPRRRTQGARSRRTRRN